MKIRWNSKAQFVFMLFFSSLVFFFPFFIKLIIKFLFSIKIFNILFFFEKNKYPCRFLRYLYNDQKNANSCKEDCLKMDSRRFGNAMIQFLRVLQVSRLAGIKTVFFPKNLLNQKKSFSIRGIDFIPMNSTNILNCYSKHFFDPIPKLPRLHFFIESEFKTQFKKYLYNITIPNNTLVIHIRSGDIFRRHPFFKYGQPPCNYYLDVIHMRNWSQIILVAEDNKNPCIKILSKEANINFKVNNLTTDLSILLNAPNLVLSRGSFGYAIILLSNKLKNLFMFNQSSSRIPDHFNCVPSDKYYNKILKYWKNSWIQRKMMTNSHCLKWEFIPRGPKNDHIFLHEHYI